MQGSTASKQQATLIPGLVVLKLSHKASETRDTAGDTDRPEASAFTRITIASAPVRAASPYSQTLQQSYEHFTLHKADEPNSPHQQQQQGQLNQVRRSTPTPSQAGTHSPSRIPPAPAPASSDVYTKAVNHHPGVLPGQHGAGTAPAASNSSKPNSKRTTAEEQATLLPALGSAHPQAPAASLNMDSSSSHQRASSDKVAETATLRSTDNSSSRQTISHQALRPSTPSSPARNKLKNPMNSDSSSPVGKASRSPKKMTGTGLATAAVNFNSISANVHPSIAAILAPGPLLPPAMQHHKDRRRAELYALNAVLARNDELRVQEFLTEHQQQPVTAAHTMQPSNSTGAPANDMNHGV